MSKTESTSKAIDRLIEDYNYLVKGIDIKSRGDKSRAPGGILRAGIGTLVEGLSKKIIEIAWKEIDKGTKHLSFEKHTIKIPLNKKYISRIKNPEVKEYISNNIQKIHYPLKTDVQVNIDGKFVIGVESKKYTENAMLKRVLVDFTLRKQIYPDLICVLLQLESQLGGDYSEISKSILFGSHSAHVLLSNFEVDLHIITLLEGERKVDKPIYEPKYFKELKKENVFKAVEVFKTLLRHEM